MKMSIDNRVVMNKIEATKLGDIDTDNPVSRRRYYRAIRAASGLKYVTCHHVEYDASNSPNTMVAFGRATK